MKTILAISGGVDSMALLNMIAVDRKIDSSDYEVAGEYIVAHFDHGIREDSGVDEALVRRVAEGLGLIYESAKYEERSTKLRSELEAREARYKFLYEVMKKYEAERILTAHHFDDRLETMLMNVQRGTGLRGMLGFGNILTVQPLFNWLKSDIVEYALENKLEWREDSTNQSDVYLRNKFRKKLTALDDAQKLLWRNRMNKLAKQIDEIDDLVLVLNVWVCRRYDDEHVGHNDYYCELCGDLDRINRSRFSILPNDIGQMILHNRLVELETKDINKKKIETLTLAIRTGKAGKIYDICDHLVLKLSSKYAEITHRDKLKS